MAIQDAVAAIRALRPKLYTTRGQARPQDHYVRGFGDGFNDALEQVDVILSRGIDGGA